jgi:hypothetical protein
MTHEISNEESKTRTDPSWARSPHPIQKWDNFIQNANGMAVDDTSQQFNMPSFIEMKISTEDSVRYILRRNVFEVLSTIGNRQQTNESFGYPSGQAIQGYPDIVFLGGGKLIFPVEVKMAWILPDDNIAETLDAEHPPANLVDSIRQIFGYMAHNKRRYGVLSTYDKTWFIWRPENNPGALFVSDVVRVVDTAPTLLRCFAYIISLARQDPECSFPPSSPPRSPQDYHDSSDENDVEDKGPIYHPINGISPHFAHS